MNSYNPVEYWKQAGKSYYQDFKRNKTFLNQEVKLLEYLDNLSRGKTPWLDSVLEVGCGFGRITEVITDTFIINRYTALDISSEQLSHVHINNPEDEWTPDLEKVESDFMDYKPHPENRKFDLVIAVEFLMHQLPSEVQAIVNKMISLSRKHVVTLDYFSEDNAELAPHNFNHDYFTLYGHKVTMVKIGKQALFHYKK